MNDLEKAKRIVVKIGSALLVSDELGSLRETWLRALVSDMAGLVSKGVELAIVSSGSIALGRKVLGLGSGELSLEQSQAAAAVGQIRLARAYQDALAPHGLIAAQILLTLQDSEDRRRYLNSRATFRTLLRQGVIPVVNENDTVTTDEIRYGDNDRLAAQVAAMINSDRLILLSDVDGLYDEDPRKRPHARRIGVVTSITSRIEAMAEDSASALSRGGMKTKILAAKIATNAGCAMAIADGRSDSPLSALQGGKECTWFIPQNDPQSARKHWILSMKSRGHVVIDEGAARALASGKSLLPAGAIRVGGTFNRGDPVEIHDREGRSVGSGLIRYTSGEARQILGCRSAEVVRKLGYPARAALVHRDDMVVLTSG